MAFLVPQLELDGRQTTQYKAVDEHGHTLAVGKLEVDLIPGATRHGSIAFVTTDHPDDQKPEGVGGLKGILGG